jgi:hypothetical protein
MHNPTIVKLQKGEVRVYHLGDINLHSYINNDPMSDAVTLLEKNGAGVVIDPPSFYDNIKEFSEYIDSLAGVMVHDVILDYHIAGGSFLPEARKWSTKRAEKFAHFGAGKDMVANFAKSFGKAFDHELPKVTAYIDSNEITLAGIKFLITDTDEAFDMEIPEINSVYIHILTHDAHSIVTNRDQAVNMINKLRSFISRGFDLIIGTHHAPETVEDAMAKVDYLEKLIELADSSKTATEFKDKMKKAYPDYGGEQYLDMTAEFLYK